MKRNIMAHIHAENGGFVVEIPDLHAVTQGESLDEAIANLKEAVAVALEGDDPANYGLVADPAILVTLELGTLSHAG